MNGIRKIRKSCISLFILISFFSCKKTDPPVTGGTDDDDIKLIIPSGFPQPVYAFENNPLTREGFDLGKKLFYDPRLSKDNSISCGSCHQQFSAFSHLGHKLSHGIDGKFGTRNAPGLFNLIWQPNLMWDGGVHNLELQPFAPITNPLEMNETLEGVLAKLRADSAYPVQFKNVFGTDSITSQIMFKAITQFMGMLISANSKFDKYERGEVNFTTEEKQGLDLFRHKCESCHKEPFFTDFSFRNNGLDSVFADSGRATITMDANDLGKFKVPSLRNIALTFPYMHDGRYETLSEVLEHYNAHIKMSVTLDAMLIPGMALSATEKVALIAFLQTLSDTEFTKDERFQEPPK